MSFTYSGTLATDLDRLRFHLGDTADGAGPKPADANFSDEELTGLIATEGSWQRAVAAGFETLAGLWAKHVTFNADGMQAGLSDVARQYRESAAEWRRGHGGIGQSGSVAATRIDGYSDDLDNVTTDDEL